MGVEDARAKRPALSGVNTPAMRRPETLGRGIVFTKKCMIGVQPSSKPPSPWKAYEEIVVGGGANPFFEI